MAKVQQLIDHIREGRYDRAFTRLYAADEKALEKQKARYIQALEQFALYYGTDREAALYSAPGRTEIGGNHTDHNHGVVLAGAVNLDVIAVVSKNEDGFIRIKSYGFDSQFVVDLSDLTPHENEFGSSDGLIRGVAAGIAKEGGQVGGFDAYFTSDVLQGSGLSSSAAFEVMIGAILRGEYNGNDMETFSQVEIAKISQYAENVFFGKPCGLMDQTACAVGGVITIDFKDNAHPVVNQVPFDLAGQGYALCISDTKGSHADLTDDYAAIRREMESVAEFFGKNVLREVDEADFYANIAKIRPVTGDRAVLRAAHFYADSRRARQLYEAIQDNRFQDFLKLIVEGGHSSFEYNQNAYSLSNYKEQGVSIGLAVSQKILAGRGAWRLQGGGFAGTIQAFVPLDLLETYRSTIDSVFGEGSCYVLSVRNYGAVPVTEEM